jgi:hypothetical protein
VLQKMINFRLSSLCLFALAFSLASCTKTSREYESPDGAYSATLEITDPGAFATTRARVILHDKAGRIGRDSIEIFEGRGGWPIGLHWQDSRNLVIEFCGASSYKIINAINEDRASNQPATPMRFRAFIAKDDTQSIRGKIYCDY